LWEREDEFDEFRENFVFLKKFRIKCEWIWK